MGFEEEKTTKNVVFRQSGGGSTTPQNGEVKALSVSVPPMIFVNAMTP